ncbi:MAG: prepilin-type N-terminal cleavage/methylation domain-containing protein [Verrucomicrobia bacterium]|nr:prepilin-type N-terminal cleavage/methylation domain-containing protein [Verrucomicrobiota bacterium]
MARFGSIFISRFRGRASCRGGFTLIELLVVIALIGILTTLFAPELATVREQAEKVICMGHLRSLHASFGAYLNDYEMWPQFPKDSTGAEANLSPQQEDQFWLDALKEYGADASVWRCPSFRRSTQEFSAADSDASQLNYTPTQFDDNPLTPRKWPGMPWLIDQGAHRGENLMIRADGAVQTVQEAFKQSSN